MSGFRKRKLSPDVFFNGYYFTNIPNLLHNVSNNQSFSLGLSQAQDYDGPAFHALCWKPEKLINYNVFTVYLQCLQDASGQSLVITDDILGMVSPRPEHFFQQLVLGLHLVHTHVPVRHVERVSEVAYAQAQLWCDAGSRPQAWCRVYCDWQFEKSVIVKVVGKTSRRKTVNGFVDFWYYKRKCWILLNIRGIEWVKKHLNWRFLQSMINIS